MLSNRLLALVIGVAFAAACSGRDDAAPADFATDAARADVLDGGSDAANAEADGSASRDDGGLLHADAGLRRDDGGPSVDGSAQAVKDAQASLDAASDAGAATNQCPGATPATFPAQAGRCRIAADCHSWERCGPRYDPPGCGACNRAERACEDGGCAAGLVCVERVLPCTCPAIPSTLCQARCTASSCAVDELCGADGKCAPRTCKQGYACTPQQVCAPDRMFADVHGCAVAHCDADGVACPAGFRCAATLSAPSSNGCVSIQCNDGFTCPPNRICSPTSPQPHGCEFKSCTRDEDCGCGVCLGNRCEDELFVCSPPPAP
jgi:hypothetical protein